MKKVNLTLTNKDVFDVVVENMKRAKHYPNRYKLIIPGGIVEYYTYQQIIRISPYKGKTYYNFDGFELVKDIMNTKYIPEYLQYFLLDGLDEIDRYYIAKKTRKYRRHKRYE